MKVSIIVPCYNEENIAFNTYKEIKKEIERITKDYEIIFANDGSVDNTLNILKDISKNDKRFRFITWFPNKGMGYALRSLYKEAKGKIVIQMDADLSTKPNIFNKFMEEIKIYDVVIASKYLDDNNIPFYRKLPSRIYNLVNNVLFNLKIKDTQSGFVAYRKNILNKIKLKCNGFDIHMELLAKLAKGNAKIKEIPATYVHRSKGTKFSVLKNGPSTLFNTFKIWYNLRWR